MEICIILITRAWTWEEQRGNTCEQDAEAGGRGISPRRMANIYRIIKEANPEPWVREKGSGGAARTVTLQQDGRR